MNPKTKKQFKRLAPKQSEYSKIMDALNIIDEQANDEFESDDLYKNEKQREKAYNMVADFIDKHAKHI
jgi:hypothetical protein